MPSAKSLVALTLAAAACKPQLPGGALVVGSIAVSEAGLAGKPEIGESAENLRLKLRAALEASGRFSIRAAGPVRIQLDIDRAQRTLAPPPVFDPSKPVLEHEVAEVAVTLEMTTSNAQGPVERMVAEGGARRPTNADDSLDPSVRHAAFNAALDEAVRDAVAALGAQIDARHKTDEALLKDLTAADPRVRDFAIRVLADRRSPAAVPQLIARLQDPSPEVARRAAGALIAIGDRRAVGPLIEMTRHRHAEDVGPILYAIASLGGAEAEAFLFTLESGAPDEETRRAAKGAYEDLIRRKKDEARLSQRRRAHP
jgi:HEAT repeat protein